MDRTVRTEADAPTTADDLRTDRDNSHLKKIVTDALHERFPMPVQTVAPQPVALLEGRAPKPAVADAAVAATVPADPAAH